MRFKEKLSKIRQENEMKRILNNIEKIISDKRITKNPVLIKLKKDMWNINTKNKHLARATAIYTLDIIRAALVGE